MTGNAQPGGQQMLKETRRLYSLLQFLLLKNVESLHIETFLARGSDSSQHFDTAAYPALLLSAKILVSFWKRLLCVYSLVLVLKHSICEF